MVLGSCKNFMRPEQKSLYFVDGRTYNVLTGWGKVLMNYREIYQRFILKMKNRCVPPKIKEFHHIVPVSLGGSNHESNLVALTQREHLFCHLLLAKMFKNDEVNRRKMYQAAFMVMRCANNTNGREIIGSKHKWIEDTFSEELSKFMKIFQKGNSNSNFGSKWFYDPETYQSIRMKDGSKPGGGYIPGRKIKPKGTTFEEKLAKTRKETKDKRISENITKYTAWYRIYNDVGFAEFCNIVGYECSQPALVKMFAKYVEGFTPQNGKRRGNIWDRSLVGRAPDF